MSITNTQPFRASAHQAPVPAFKVYLLCDEDMNGMIADASRNGQNPKVSFIVIDNKKIPYTRSLTFTAKDYEKLTNGGKDVSGLTSRRKNSEQMVHCQDMSKKCPEDSARMSRKEIDDLKAAITESHGLKLG
jgi:hypothetical protein